MVERAIAFSLSRPPPEGGGAWSNGDGQDYLINEVNGSFRDLPVEIFERKYPVRILKYAIRTDSGGRGGSEAAMARCANIFCWLTPVSPCGSRDRSRRPGV